MRSDEKVAVQFLAGKGLRVEGFSDAERSLSKTPDYKVFQGTSLAFFCEVKSIAEDSWLPSQTRGCASWCAGWRCAARSDIQSPIYKDPRGGSAV